MPSTLRCFLLLGLFSFPFVSHAKLTQAPQQSEAYLQGVAEAHQEMEEGFLTSYTYGLRSRAGYDQDLALPLQAIAGCEVDEAILERAAGHNDTIRRWLQEGRRLPNSLAPFQGALEFPEKVFPPSRFEPLATLTQAPFHQVLSLTPAEGAALAPRFFNRQHHREFQLWLYSSWTDIQIAFPRDSGLYFVLRFQDGSPKQWHYQVYDGVAGTLLTTKTVHVE